jgi:hypothetical protein
MNKLIFSGLLLCVTIGFNRNANAQELNVVASSGTYTEGATHSIAWTIGEAVTASLIFPDNHVTQGFHQSDLYVLSVDEFQPLIISVYPNPARDIINITSDEPSRMSIYDMQGKLITTIDVNSSTSELDVSYLSRGTYSLVFEAKGAIAKTMKIIKQ